jgi:hypothetical protein
MRQVPLVSLESDMGAHLDGWATDPILIRGGITSKRNPRLTDSGYLLRPRGSGRVICASA